MYYTSYRLENLLKVIRVRNEDAFMLHKKTLAPEQKEAIKQIGKSCDPHVVQEYLTNQGGVHVRPAFLYDDTPETYTSRNQNKSFDESKVFFDIQSQNIDGVQAKLVDSDGVERAVFNLMRLIFENHKAYDQKTIVVQACNLADDRTIGFAVNTSGEIVIFNGESNHGDGAMFRWGNFEQAIIQGFEKACANYNITQTYNKRYSPSLGNSSYQEPENCCVPIAAMMLAAVDPEKSLRGQEGTLGDKMEKVCANEMDLRNTVFKGVTEKKVQKEKVSQPKITSSPLPGVATIQDMVKAFKQPDPSTPTPSPAAASGSGVPPSASKSVPATTVTPTSPAPVVSTPTPSAASTAKPSSATAATAATATTSTTPSSPSSASPTPSSATSKPPTATPPKSTTTPSPSTSTTTASTPSTTPKILVINGHGYKQGINFKLQKNQGIITPGDPENSYGIAFDNEKRHLEEMTSQNQLWPVIDRNTKTEIKWHYTSEGNEVPDVKITPLEDDFDITEFFQKVLKGEINWKNLTAQSSLKKLFTSNLDVLKKGALAVRHNKEISILEEKELREYLEAYIEDPNKTLTDQGQALFFCYKELGKVKPLVSDVALSDIYKGIAEIEEFKERGTAIVVATCSPAGEDIKNVFVIDTTRKPIEITEVLKATTPKMTTATSQPASAVAPSSTTPPKKIPTSSPASASTVVPPSVLKSASSSATAPTTSTTTPTTPPKNISKLTTSPTTSTTSTTTKPTTPTSPSSPSSTATSTAPSTPSPPMSLPATPSTTTSATAAPTTPTAHSDFDPILQNDKAFDPKFFRDYILKQDSYRNQLNKNTFLYYIPDNEAPGIKLDRERGFRASFDINKPKLVYSLSASGSKDAQSPKPASVENTVYEMMRMIFEQRSKAGVRVGAEPRQTIVMQAANLGGHTIGFAFNTDGECVIFDGINNNEHQKYNVAAVQGFRRAFKEAYERDYQHQMTQSMPDVVQFVPTRDPLYTQNMQCCVVNVAIMLAEVSAEQPIRAQVANFHKRIVEINNGTDGNKVTAQTEARNKVFNGITGPSLTKEAPIKPPLQFRPPVAASQPQPASSGQPQMTLSPAGNESLQKVAQLRNEIYDVQSKIDSNARRIALDFNIIEDISTEMTRLDGEIKKLYAKVPKSSFEDDPIGWFEWRRDVAYLRENYEALGEKKKEIVKPTDMRIAENASYLKQCEKLQAEISTMTEKAGNPSSQPASKATATPTATTATTPKTTLTSTATTATPSPATTTVKTPPLPTSSPAPTVISPSDTKATSTTTTATPTTPPTPTPSAASKPTTSPTTPTVTTTTPSGSNAFLSATASSTSPPPTATTSPTTTTVTTTPLVSTSPTSPAASTATTPTSTSASVSTTTTTTSTTSTTTTTPTTTPTSTPAPVSSTTTTTTTSSPAVNLAAKPDEELGEEFAKRVNELNRVAQAAPGAPNPKLNRAIDVLKSLVTFTRPEDMQKVVHSINTKVRATVSDPTILTELDKCSEILTEIINRKLGTFVGKNLKVHEFPLSAVSDADRDLEMQRVLGLAPSAASGAPAPTLAISSSNPGVAKMPDHALLVAANPNEFKIYELTTVHRKEQDPTNPTGPLIPTTKPVRCVHYTDRNGVTHLKSYDQFNIPTPHEPPIYTFTTKSGKEVSLYLSAMQLAYKILRDQTNNFTELNNIVNLDKLPGPEDTAIACYIAIAHMRKCYSPEISLGTVPTDVPNVDAKYSLVIKPEKVIKDYITKNRGQFDLPVNADDPILKAQDDIKKYNKGP